MKYTYKMFTALDAVQLLDALAQEETNDKRVPVSICQVSPFSGAVADFLVIFTTKKV